jgi:diguanylate cyclase (GGDEF)-like protein/PAS domain S-box-containing protein
VKDKVSSINKGHQKTGILFDREEERMILATAIEQTSVAILITNIDGDIIYANPAFENISGYTIAEIIGENPRIVKSGLTDPMVYEKMWKTISSGGIWNGEQINKRKDGRLYYEDSRITPIYNKDNKLTYYMAVKHDISERKALEERLKETAIRDSLTNAYNRRYLFERINQITSNYKRSQKPFSIAILDIDSYKNINDTYGHQAGDFVLVEFVRLINENIRPYDVLGRYGGEEFIIVLPDTNKEEAHAVIYRILKVVRDKTFQYGDSNIKFTFSAGISDSGEIELPIFNSEDLLRIADKRLYEAKEAEKNKIII